MKKTKNTKINAHFEQLGSQFFTEEEEADEARELLKYMLQNVEEADARVERTRNRFFHELEEYTRRWRREDGLNIGKDSDEISDATRKMGG